jgi:RNA polymerase sigma-70 factor (ECF subfamily)
MASLEGDQRGFDEALSHLDALYSTALRLTKDAAAADDLIQDTFLKAHRFFSRFEPGTNLKAWLYTILMNTFRNQLRRARREPVHFDVQEVDAFVELRTLEGGSPQRNPEEEYFELASVERIVQAITALPLPFREAIELACLQQFSYREVCDLLQVPIGTVMSRIHRGRKLLQAELLNQARAEGRLR